MVLGGAPAQGLLYLVLVLFGTSALGLFVRQHGPVSASLLLAFCTAFRFKRPSLGTCSRHRAHRAQDGEAQPPLHVRLSPEAATSSPPLRRALFQAPAHLGRDLPFEDVDAILDHDVNAINASHPALLAAAAAINASMAITGLGSAMDLGADYDGDGARDWILGAPLLAVGGRQVGGVFFLSAMGGPRGVPAERLWQAGDDLATSNVTIVSLTSTAGNANITELGGTSFKPAFGASVALLGDVDSNGWPDVAVGAPGDVFGKDASGGRVFILFMGAGPRVLRYTVLDRKTVPGLRPSAFIGQARLGHSVVGLRDLNSDGVPDLAIGARTTRHTWLRVPFARGPEVLVVFLDQYGQARNVTHLHNLVEGGGHQYSPFNPQAEHWGETPPRRPDGTTFDRQYNEHHDDWFGLSLAYLGRGVLAIGAPGRRNADRAMRSLDGTVVLLTLSPTGMPTRLHLIDNGAFHDLQLAKADENPQIRNGLGMSLAAVPPANGDGTMDLLIGAPPTALLVPLDDAFRPSGEYFSLSLEGVLWRPNATLGDTVPSTLQGLREGSAPGAWQTWAAGMVAAWTRDDAPPALAGREAEPPQLNAALQLAISLPGVLWSEEQPTRQCGSYLPTYSSTWTMSTLVYCPSASTVDPDSVSEFAESILFTALRFPPAPTLASQLGGDEEQGPAVLLTTPTFISPAVEEALLPNASNSESLPLHDRWEYAEEAVFGSSVLALPFLTEAPWPSWLEPQGDGVPSNNDNLPWEEGHAGKWHKKGIRILLIGVEQVGEASSGTVGLLQVAYDATARQVIASHMVAVNQTAVGTGLLSGVKLGMLLGFGRCMAFLRAQQNDGDTWTRPRGSGRLVVAAPETQLVNSTQKGALVSIPVTGFEVQPSHHPSGGMTVMSPEMFTSIEPYIGPIADAMTVIRTPHWDNMKQTEVAVAASPSEVSFTPFGALAFVSASNSHWMSLSWPGSPAVCSSASDGLTRFGASVEWLGGSTIAVLAPDETQVCAGVTHGIGSGAIYVLSLSFITSSSLAQVQTWHRIFAPAMAPSPGAGFPARMLRLAVAPSFAQDGTPDLLITTSGTAALPHAGSGLQEAVRTPNSVSAQYCLLHLDSQFKVPTSVFSRPVTCVQEGMPGAVPSHAVLNGSSSAVLMTGLNGSAPHLGLATALPLGDPDGNGALDVLMLLPGMGVFSLLPNGTVNSTAAPHQGAMMAGEIVQPGWGYIPRAYGPPGGGFGVSYDEQAELATRIDPLTWAPGHKADYNMARLYLAAMGKRMRGCWETGSQSFVPSTGTVFAKYVAELPQLSSPTARALLNDALGELESAEWTSADGALTLQAWVGTVQGPADMDTAGAALLRDGESDGLSRVERNLEGSVLVSGSGDSSSSSSSSGSSSEDVEGEVWTSTWRDGEAVFRNASIVADGEETLMGSQVCHVRSKPLECEEGGASCLHRFAAVCGEFREPQRLARQLSPYYVASNLNVGLGSVYGQRAERTADSLQCNFWESNLNSRFSSTTTQLLQGATDKYRPGNSMFPGASVSASNSAANVKDLHQASAYSLGMSMAPMHDFDGDGVAEMLVGAPLAGEIGRNYGLTTFGREPAQLRRSNVGAVFMVHMVPGNQSEAGTKQAVRTPREWNSGEYFYGSTGTTSQHANVEPGEKVLADGMYRVGHFDRIGRHSTGGHMHLEDGDAASTLDIGAEGAQLGCAVANVGWHNHSGSPRLTMATGASGIAALTGTYSSSVNGRGAVLLLDFSEAGLLVDWSYVDVLDVHMEHSAALPPVHPKNRFPVSLAAAGDLEGDGTVDVAAVFHDGSTRKRYIVLLHRDANGTFSHSSLIAPASIPGLPPSFTAYSARPEMGFGDSMTYVGRGVVAIALWRASPRVLDKFNSSAFNPAAPYGASTSGATTLFRPQHMKAETSQSTAGLYSENHHPVTREGKGMLMLVRLGRNGTALNASLLQENDIRPFGIDVGGTTVGIGLSGLHPELLYGHVGPSSAGQVMDDGAEPGSEGVFGRPSMVPNPLGFSQENGFASSIPDMLVQVDSWRQKAHPKWRNGGEVFTASQYMDGTYRRKVNGNRWPLQGDVKLLQTNNKGSYYQTFNVNWGALATSYWNFQPSVTGIPDVSMNGLSGHVMPTAFNAFNRRYSSTGPSSSTKKTTARMGNLMSAERMFEQSMARTGSSSTVTRGPNIGGVLRSTSFSASRNPMPRSAPLRELATTNSRSDWIRDQSDWYRAQHNGKDFFRDAGLQAFSDYVGNSFPYTTETWAGGARMPPGATVPPMGQSLYFPQIANAKRFPALQAGKAPTSMPVSTAVLCPFISQSEFFYRTTSYVPAVSRSSWSSAINGFVDSHLKKESILGESREQYMTGSAYSSVPSRFKAFCIDNLQQTNRRNGLDNVWSDLRKLPHNLPHPRDILWPRMFGNQALRYFGERIQRHAEIYAVYLNPDGSVRQSVPVVKASPLYDRMLPNWSNIGSSMALLRQTESGMLHILTAAAYMDDLKMRGSLNTWGYAKTSNFYVLEALPAPPTQYEPVLVPEHRLSTLASVVRAGNGSSVPPPAEVLAPVSPWVRPSVVPLLWSPSPSSTATPSTSNTATASVSGTPSNTPSSTSSPTSTASPSVSSEVTSSPSSSVTADVTASVSPSPTSSTTASASATVKSASPTPSPTASATGAATPTASSSAAATPSTTRSPDPSVPAAPSQSAAPSTVPGVTPPPRRVLPRVTYIDAATPVLPLTVLSVSAFTSAAALVDVPVTFRALGELTSIGAAVASVKYVASPAPDLLALASSDPIAAAAAMADEQGGSPPSARVLAPSLAGPLSLTAFTSLNTRVQVSLSVTDVRSSSDAASFQGLFLFNVTAYSSASFDTLLSIPLLVHVKLPAGSATPEVIEGYAVPDGDSSSMEQSLTIDSSGTADLDWFLLQDQPSQCWLSVSSVGGLVPSRGELLALAPTRDVLQADPALRGALHGTTQPGSVSTVRIAMDLSQLPQGLHRAELVLVLGDVQGTVQTIPVRILVATVQPCPGRVRVPPLAPPASLGSGAAASTAVTALSLRNLGVDPVAVVDAAVLDGDVAIAPVADACASSRNSTDVSAAVEVQFDALAALASLEAASTSWLSVAPMLDAGVVIPPLGDAVAPLSVRISDSSTPEPGQYTGTVLILLNDTRTGALTLGSSVVSVRVAQGTAALGQSSLLPLTSTLSGQHLPLQPSTVITSPYISDDDQLMTPDGVLLALVVLRDALGRPRQAGQDVVAARLLVNGASGRSLSGSGANSSSIPAVARTLTGSELALLRSLHGALVSSAEVGVPANQAPQTFMYGVFLSLSTVRALPVGAGLRFEVDVLNVDAGSAGGELSTRLASPAGAAAITVARAECGPNQVQTGLVCECAAGYGVAPQAPQGAALSPASLVCAPCGAGKVGVVATAGRVTSPAVCQRCGDGTFSLPGSTACSACPEGAVCGDGILAVLPGFALASTLVDADGAGLVPGTEANDIGANIFLCPNPLACEAGQATSLQWSNYSIIPTGCAAGHEGDLCGVCADSYTYSPVAGGASVDCVRCHESSSALLAATTLMSLVLLGLLLCAWRGVLFIMGGKPQGAVEVPPALQVPFVQGESKADWVQRSSGASIALIVDGGSAEVSGEGSGPASSLLQVRFVALWLLVLHLQWSSQLDSYRLGTVEGMEGVSTLSHIASIFPVHAQYTSCVLGARDLVTTSFGIGASLPVLGLLAGCIVAGVVVACSALCGKQRRECGGREVLGAIGAACGLSMFMTVPRSLLSMVTVFLTLPASPQAEYMLQGFKYLAGSELHVQLQVTAGLLAVLWGVVPLVVLWRGRPVLPAGRLADALQESSAGGHGGSEKEDADMESLRDEVECGADGTTTWPVATAATALLYPDAAGTLLSHAQMQVEEATSTSPATWLWTSLGWSWGFFRPSMWWYSLVWLGQCFALALAAAASPFLINRAYMAGAVCAVCMAANLWLQPLLMTGDAPAWVGLPLLQHAVRSELDKRAGHSLRLAAVTRLQRQSVLLHSLSVLVQGGVMVQAGFTFAMYAWRSGAFFAEAGRSNPYLSAVEVDLQAADAVVVAGVNCGFWVPVLGLLLVLAVPSAALQGTSALAKVLAAGLAFVFRSPAARRGLSKSKLSSAGTGEGVELSSLSKTVLAKPSQGDGASLEAVRSMVKSTKVSTPSAATTRRKSSRRTSLMLRNATADSERMRSASIQSLVDSAARGEEESVAGGGAPGAVGRARASPSFARRKKSTSSG